MKYRFQALREVFAIAAFVALLAAAGWVLAVQKELIGYLLMECALVFSILSETYAIDK